MTDTKIAAGNNSLTFASQGLRLAANLYTPAGFDRDASYPAVIFTGPFNQVKEQTGAVYGAKLARKGYVALVYDNPGYGDSEGDIRNFENPYWKMEAVRDGVSFLGTLPFVDKDRLYGLGVCAGGGYMPLVAVTD